MLHVCRSVYKWAGHVQDTARTLRSQPALKLTTRPSDSVGVLSDSFNGMIYKEREELIKKYLLRDEVSSQ